MRTFALSACLLLLSAPLAAQRGVHDVPLRPPLGAAADTNNARHYLSLGVSRLESRPNEAAAAFYWAHQLDPSSAEALYGRYAALLLMNPQRLQLYWEGDRRTLNHPEIIAIDSLYLQALWLNPLVERRFEASLFRTVLHAWVRRELSRQPGGMGVSEVEITNYTSQFIRTASPYVRAREASAAGRYEEALQLYDHALRQARRKKSHIHTDRALVLNRMRRHPEALLELNHAMREMRREDARDLVYLYESKAMLEHSTGMLMEMLGNVGGARAAYGRALEEDLAFAHSHVRLAVLSLEAGEREGGVAALQMAVMIRPEDAVVRSMLGQALLELGEYAEAADHLEHATRIAPHYAEPYHGLGLARLELGELQEAHDAFTAFVERAPRGTAALSAARGHLSTIEGRLARAVADR